MDLFPYITYIFLLGEGDLKRILQTSTRVRVEKIYKSQNDLSFGIKNQFKKRENVRRGGDNIF